LRTLLRLPGDSVLAEDGIAGRMTMLDGSGNLVRTWATGAVLPLNVRPPIGRLADGSFVAIVENALARPPGHLRYTATIVRYDNGSNVDTIGRVPGGESYNVPCGPANSGMCNVGVPYGIRTLAAVSGDRIYVGNGGRYEILVFTPRGRRIDTIARAVAPTPLTATRIEFFRDSVTAGMTATRRESVLQQLAAAPLRPTMPFFTQLMADDAGRLWAARPQEAGAHFCEWDVFGANGAFVGTVLLPGGLRVTHIGRDRVVGIGRDSNGVEVVHVFGLVSGAASGR
jgi:hypothetical protein